MNTKKWIKSILIIALMLLALGIGNYLFNEYLNNLYSEFASVQMTSKSNYLNFYIGAIKFLNHLYNIIVGFIAGKGVIYEICKEEY